MNVYGLDSKLSGENYSAWESMAIGHMLGNEVGGKVGDLLDELRI